MNGLLIWGAGGHGKVVLDVAQATQIWDTIAFIDDCWSAGKTEFMGLPVLGAREQLPLLLDRGYSEFIVAIGVNVSRAKCFAEALARGFLPATMVHPTSVVSRSALIGPGTVVMPRAVVNAGSVIGEDSIINTGAVVEHDCVVGSHVHLSPGVVLGGGVRIGAYAHVGLSATVLPHAEIGEFATIGAGAVVLHSVVPGETVVGVPARPVTASVRRLRA
jgi:sugar O-acyltransferase (sialic acid O-acetyltransferase NeuD family)